MIISLIAAIAENNTIGKNNRLLWHMPADLKHFKDHTIGHSIIMGRKTFDSVGKPLANRRNIVISSNKDLQIEGCEVVHSLGQALDLCKNEEEVFIVGGAMVYNEALPLADKIYLTRIHQSFEGDAFFPEIDAQKWREVSRKDLKKDEKNRYEYSFLEFERNRG